ncbi:hypothetical protein LEP1GSC038_2163 [Leptospira weilii str. 2006001855]|uniref:Uncharacterized protein n=1 Tax=Leptospira weilii str. 2006001855 TaxID=996804 RepID=M6FRV8_9LEPT|nr:hypothetical protein LEP1GSC051_3468 [Leptospira sp. P2653]EMM73927.1 hypothetical protein LEP1GSC038_2163 [Leptospira weilii str. 2006001855]
MRKRLRNSKTVGINLENVQVCDFRSGTSKKCGNPRGFSHTNRAHFYSKILKSKTINLNFNL